MTLAFSFQKHFIQCQADKDRPKCATERVRWKADLSFSHHFLSENRATSVRAVANKENILSGGGSSLGFVGEDKGSNMDSQGGKSCQSARTPKARKSKHSPTLVQFTDNKDAHAVSHHAFSHHLFFSLLFVILAVSL